MRTPYQSYSSPMMNGGRGQRMAQMLQMQGQSQQVSNNAGTDMQYSPPQNAANVNQAPRQFLRQYQKMPKTPGMTNPQGGVDRGGFENG